MFIYPEYRLYDNADKDNNNTVKKYSGESCSYIGGYRITAMHARDNSCGKATIVWGGGRFCKVFMGSSWTEAYRQAVLSLNTGASI